MNNKEDLLEKSLSFILLLQLLVENLESLPPEIRRQKLKQQSKALIKTAEPIINTWYNKMFNSDEGMTQNICWELDKLVKQISNLDLMGKVDLSQLIEATAIDRDTMLGTAHRVIKKKMKNVKV